MEAPQSVRTLPPNSPGTIEKLNNATLEDHYVAFIFYCNPSLPSNLSTTELRRGFRSVPRTDGKSFETLTVFHLVHKLDRGEIPTWIALVTELGVEPPDLAKGGSGQKLQQYGVRLKRWAHAYHIDAFFQYMIGNSHPYYTQIPDSPNPIAHPRDGVPPDEDLALRALVPDLRPKRGRKKGHDDDNDSIDTPNKRLRAGTPSTVDGRNSPRPDMWGNRVSQSPAPSYIPQHNTHMAHLLPAPQRSNPIPEYTHEEQLNDLFSAASRAFGGDNLQTAPASAMQQEIHQWSIPSVRARNEYPQSAIDLHPPSNAFDSPEMHDGSRSAHPLAGRSGKSKKRGSTVSAAWNTTSANQNLPNSGQRTRGRPPQKRNDKDAAFRTWALKDSIEEDQISQIPREPEMPRFNAETLTVYSPAAVAPMRQTNIGTTQDAMPPRRPPTKKLSLTVPHQPGGNVRLATPPVHGPQAGNVDASPLPRVILNDDGSLSRPRSSMSKTRERESIRDRERQRSRLFAEDRNQRRTSADYFNSVDEEASQNDAYDTFDDDMSNASTINWKQRARVLERKLKEAQDELKRVKKAVLEAVM